MECNSLFKNYCAQPNKQLYKWVPHQMKNQRIITNHLRDAMKQTDFKVQIVGNDLSQVHFSIKGPAGTIFEGGIYHGLIRLPAEFPFKAPDIELITPSGRFEVNKKICVNGYTAWHQDTWSPAINITAIVHAVQSLFSDLDQHGIGYDFPIREAEVKKHVESSKQFVCPHCKMEHKSLEAALQK